MIYFKSQIPNPKSQRNPKHQYLMTKTILFDSLKLTHWNLFVIYHAYV
jgi:hypothetical protein